MSNSSVLEKFKNVKVGRKILVVQDIKTNIYSRDVLSSSKMVGEMEVFRTHELMNVLIDHIYQPKFEPYMTQTEMDEVMTNYQMNETDFPKMYVTDPIARYYDLKCGQIVRIERPSMVAVKSQYYRKVVESSIDNVFPKIA